MLSGVVVQPALLSEMLWKVFLLQVKNASVRVLEEAEELLSPHTPVEQNFSHGVICVCEAGELAWQVLRPACFTCRGLKMQPCASIDVHM